MAGQASPTNVPTTEHQLTPSTTQAQAVTTPAAELSGPRTRSSTAHGSLVKSTHMKTHVSPGKTLPANVPANEPPSSSDLISSRLSSLETHLKDQFHINNFYAETIAKLEKHVNCLEGELMLVNSRLSVRDHIVDGLRGEIHRLQQYTRRYSVSISGIEKTSREETDAELREKVLKVVSEVTSTTKEGDIDKTSPHAKLQDTPSHLTLINM